MSMPTVLPKTRHTATVIFLHGLGDTGHGWCQMFDAISEPFVKYLFPNAPIKPVTLNMGMKMPSWFDIKSLTIGGEEDAKGIADSSAQLKCMIQEEIKGGIPSEKIIIGGFSQGGAVALYTALTSDVKLGGIIGLSTWLPLNGSFPAASSGQNSSTPMLLGHGNTDPVVNYAFGVQTKECCKKMNNQVVFNTYNGLGHSSSPKEMEDVKEFVKKCLL